MMGDKAETFCNLRATSQATLHKLHWHNSLPQTLRYVLMLNFEYELDQSSVTSVTSAWKLLLIIVWSDVAITKLHTLAAKFVMKATEIHIVQGSPEEEKKSIPMRPMKRVSIIP